MVIPETFLGAEYALLHGDDSEGRRSAQEAWKLRHVDPEWADFSLTVCAEGCPWAEVQNALSECAPLGVCRVVVVPQAENLLEKVKELPVSIKAILAKPFPDTRLLLVSRVVLSAASGRSLGTKPFSEWLQQGRVFKVGALDGKEAPGYVEAQAEAMGLKLEAGVAARIAARLGGNPGILCRTLEVLDLLAENRRVGGELVDQATFRLGEQNAFAWSQAWQKGQLSRALETLHQALEEDPSGSPLLLLGQARRDVDRLVRFMEARSKGVKSTAELMGALGLSSRQGFLLEGYGRTLDRIGPEGVTRLLRLINQTDLDLKGLALSGGKTPLLFLTVSLCRAWGIN